MPKRRAFSILFALGAAMSVAGCEGMFGDGPAPVTAGPTGGEEYSQFLADARNAMAQNDLAQAAQWLDEARQLEPENPSLWVAIARLRFRGGEHLQALDAAVRATELGPDYAPALMLRAQFVRDAHGMQDALPWFEAALAADPENIDILTEYAATLGDGGWHQEMLSTVRQMAEIDSLEPRIFYLQAVLAARGGETVLARALLERSGLAVDGVPAAILLDALLDMEQGTAETAAQKLEELYERQPGNERVLELLAKALWLSGRDEEMIATVSERARSADASPYFLALVGRAYERLGQRAEAAPFLERAYKSRSRDLVVIGSTDQSRRALPQPSRELRDAIAQGESQRAIGLARDLREQFPGSADVYSLLGDVEQARQRPDWALELYGAAASVRRPWPLTKRIYAAAYGAGDLDAADTLLTRHISAEPNNAEAIILLAQRSAEREDWLRVAVLLDYAIGLGAGHDPALLSLRARAAQQLGNVTESDRFRAMAAEIRPAPFVPAT